ncbi:hypothetical protein [Corynebacterium cystitidis]|uniref:hypothetical protein n=1 Tax=Corynebacterium cystitidis TaxID=35757 RepID=UPI00211F34DA|nr:hypothetical protein [Corynebacterium cystitidis]
MKTENYIEHASEGFDGIGAILRRRKAWVAAGVILGLLAALVFTQLVPRQCTATAHVHISAPKDAQGSGKSSKNAIDMDSQRELAGSEKTANAAADKLGGSWTSRELLDGVEVGGDSESTIMSVSFTADSAERAVEGATGMAQAFIQVGADSAKEQHNTAVAAIDEQIKQQQEALGALQNSTTWLTEGEQSQAGSLRDFITDLQERRIELETTGDLNREIITGAEANPVTSGLSVLQTLFLGLLGGLALGVVLALIAHATSRRPADSAEIERIVGAPIFRPTATEGNDTDTRWNLATIFAGHAIGQGKKAALLFDDRNNASSNAAKTMANSLGADLYGVKDSWIDAIKFAGVVDAVVIVLASTWTKDAIRRLRADLDKVDANVVGVVVADAKPDPVGK